MTELEKCIIAKENGFTYNHITGDVIGVKGKPRRTVNNGKYIRFIAIRDGVAHNIFAHRFAWFMHYGQLPKNQIDHIDGNMLNNKIENLRDVTSAQNHWNRKKVTGYSFYKHKNKYQSQIYANGKSIFLGNFDTPEEARAAYLEAKKKYHVIQ